MADNRNLPSNISFSAEPLEQVYKKADYCITCSSTAGIETAFNDIPTVFYLDYPDSSKEPMTEASIKNFKESGLISTYSEILDLKSNKLNEQWASDFISDNSSVIGILDKILEIQKKN